MLEAAVAPEVNRRCLEWLEGYSGPDAPTIGRSGEPSEILLEEWFVDGVLTCPAVAGVVRSLLGAGFGLPINMACHRGACPGPGQPWHHDGDSQFTPELNYLQVFYHPQRVTQEMGPCELVPKTQFVPTHQAADARGTSTASAAGSIFITNYAVPAGRGPGPHSARAAVCCRAI